MTIAGTHRNGLPADLAAECRGSDGRPSIIKRFCVIHDRTMRIGDRMTAEIGLTCSRWLLLSSLFHREEEPTVTELSADALQSVQNVSRMLRSMEDEGLVERFRKRGGGRATYVRLTPAGEEALQQAMPLREEIHRQFLEGLSPEEVRQLVGLLDRLSANLEAVEQRLGSCGVDGGAEEE